MFSPLFHTDPLVGLHCSLVLLYLFLRLRTSHMTFKVGKRIMTTLSMKILDVSECHRLKASGVVVRSEEKRECIYCRPIAYSGRASHTLDKINLRIKLWENSAVWCCVVFVLQVVTHFCFLLLEVSVIIFAADHRSDTGY